MKFLSPKTHSVIGLIVGVALLFAPNIFGFNDIGGAAVTVPRVIGVIILLSELTVKGGVSPIGFIAMKIHLMTDILIGLILALSPWLFGFHDNPSKAWVPHLVVGLLVIGYALVTRTNTEQARAEN